MPKENVIRTSKRVAKIASRVLKDPKAKKKYKSIAGSAEENRKRKTK